MMNAMKYPLIEMYVKKIDNYIFYTIYRLLYIIYY